MSRRVFPFDPMQRLVRVLIGVGLCFTGVFAWLALFPWATAVLGKVVVGEDRVAKRPWGGSIRYDRVRRWGACTVRHRERSGDMSSRRVTKHFIVIQSTGGWRIRLRQSFYKQGDELYEALRERLGDATTLRQGLFGRLRFEE